MLEDQLRERRRSKAWRRYCRAMIWLAVSTIGLLIAGIALDWRIEGPPPVHFVIAISLGLFAMIMLTAALMGLVFISSAGGYDDDIQDPRGDIDAATGNRTRPESRPWSD